MINFEDLISRDNKALLMQEDINEILNSGMAYVLFDISVSNSGHCVRFKTSDNLEDFYKDVLGENVWDGYSYADTIDSFEHELGKHGVVMGIDGKYAFIWEVV